MSAPFAPEAALAETTRRDDIAARVLRVISEHLDHPPETMTESDALRDTLGADSLDLIEMVMTLEVEFGSIEIRDSDWEDVITVGDAVEAVLAALAAAGRPVTEGRA